MKALTNEQEEKLDDLYEDIKRNYLKMPDFYQVVKRAFKAGLEENDIPSCVNKEDTECIFFNRYSLNHDVCKDYNCCGNYRQDHKSIIYLEVTK